MNHVLYAVELLSPAGDARELDTIELTDQAAQLDELHGRQAAQARLTYSAPLNAYLYGGEIVPAPLFGGLRVSVRARWISGAE